jgi:hypothetical protein
MPWLTAGRLAHSDRGSGMSSDSISPDPLVVAAQFAAAQPGWIERVRSAHIARADGTCAGCGTCRPARWPCVLVYIAGRAEQVVVDNSPCLAPPAQPIPVTGRPSDLAVRRSPPVQTRAEAACPVRPDAA